MGLLDGLIRGLLKVFCASPQQQQAPEPTYPGAGKPPYAQQPLQQQPYSAQHQYPLAQQQQWRPPQQPQQQQEQHHGQPRPHKHKPHHSHEYHLQGQGTPVVHPTSPPPTHGRVDQNQNQNLINSQNEHYVSLRASATREGDAMARAFEESHAAYARKDGAAAKELSNQGKAHQKEMERLNAEASAWIFRENNRGKIPGEVDLHGLYVKEAITYTDQSIGEARARGDAEIRLIVGKGIHSPNHAAKLKPAIEELMQKHNLSASIDPQNSGVLIVRLEGGTGAEQVRDRGGVMLGADDITRRLDRKDEGCIIM
ncbi:hypothetical protein BGY98DRAFT_706287 [Russula aff. rugulosa BPL654]|nr:hypothetical protein BGY98DRAFT_706287 [Russula aff. rugulosa BPL654]